MGSKGGASIYDEEVREGAFEGGQFGREQGFCVTLDLLVRLERNEG